MKLPINKVLNIIAGLILLGFIGSCSGLGVLKDGERLYTGSNIEFKNDSLITKKEKKQLKTGLEDNLTPKPNSTFLGMRPKLFFYNLGGDSEKKKGLGHWIKTKLGEKPVLITDVDKEFNEEILGNYSQNKGYFNAKVTSEEIDKKKTAQMNYTVDSGPRFTIQNVEFPKDSSLIGKEIVKTRDESFLKTGNPFDLDVIFQERERIDSELKNKGFYYFSPDNIIVQADSTVTKRPEMELIVKMKDDTPELAKGQWSIDKVIVFPDYNLSDIRKNKTQLPIVSDSNTLYKGKYIVDSKEKFHPRIFDRTLYFEPGELYNRSDHNLSLNRLINLGVFKFVKNEFIVSDSANHKFDVYYLLTPQKMQSLRLETLARTNSANFGGGEVNLNWTHRNIFRGAEQLKISAYGGFDVQMGGPKKGSNLYTGGLKTELAIPRLVTPFNFHSASGYVPRTVVTLGYQFQRRTKQYTLDNFTGSFGYHWRENERKEHLLNLLEVSMVSPSKVTKEFREKADSIPSLKRMIEKQFILGPTYSYTFTNTMLPKKNTFYYKGSVEFAGNVAGLITGGNVKKGKQKTMFGIPFSQFAKMEHDFRWYHKISRKQEFAARANFGIAYPYGNSETIPFTKQFFSGGSNSIRAFRARTLGPGSYDPRGLNSLFFYDESGDIKIELNAEYRLNLYKFLNAGFFVDAGNIWLINSDPDKPGGEFGSDFLSEMAVGAGFGLRFDFSILILRLDLAIPLRVPYYDKGERWRFDHIDFGSKEWRKDNLMLNIAIGYPF